jgi:hypothetical protein
MNTADLHIPIEIGIPAISGIKCRPIEVGIPIPQATVRDLSRVHLFACDKRVLADVSPLMKWPDGSIRWILVRFLAREASYAIRIGDLISDSAVPVVSLKTTADSIKISCSKADFSVSTSEFSLSSSKPDFSASVELQDSMRRPHRFKVDSVEYEHMGNIAVVLLLKGKFVRGRNRELCRGECRLRFWSGTALVHCEFTLWNPRAARHRGGIWDLGDPGSVYFRSLHFPFVFKDSYFKCCRLSLNPGEEMIDARDRELSIFQGSSGGSNWSSLAHVDRYNRPTPKFKGYRLTIGAATSEGIRCNPALIYSTESSNIAFAIENFWQCFPNRLYATEGLVSVEPFPDADNQEFELQGGEKATTRFWADFSCADEVDPLQHARVRAFPVIPVEWYSHAGFMPGCAVPSKPGGTWLDELIRSGVDGPNSFLDRRESFDEYGWRNFGDTPADHEQQHYAGKRDFISHYNNQYDLVLGFLNRFAATGDIRWFELGRDLALHVLDHDLYHTCRDKAAYNGGYFWHTAHYMHAGTATHRAFSVRATENTPIPSDFGGGPSNEHTYSSGLALYFLLTGDVRARNAVLQLSKWVQDMQDPWNTPLRFLSRNPTGLATCTRSLDFQGPGRGSAYSINTCLDAFLLTADRRWISIAENYLTSCIHPSIDPERLQLLNREDRWSYVVFLQVLGRYLDLKRDLGEKDFVSRYAEAALMRFSRWMFEREYPYLEQTEDLEYPTSTWAAQDLRKSSVFLFASKHAEPGEREGFVQKAGFFEQRSGEYLKTYTDRTSTRNMALLLAYRSACSSPSRWDDDRVVVNEKTDFGEPNSFLPQKLDALRRLRRIVLSLGLAAFPELISYMKAVRRRTGRLDADETR